MTDKEIINMGLFGSTTIPFDNFDKDKRNRAYKAYSGGATPELAVRIAEIESDDRVKDILQKTVRELKKVSYSWDSYSEDERAEFMKAIEECEKNMS